MVMTRLKPILYIILFCLSNSLFSQIQISGIVRGNIGGEVLIGANVFDPVSMRGTSTDNTGYFNLSLAESVDSIYVTYVGYTTGKIAVNRMKDSILNVTLISGSRIQEAHVVGYRNHSFNLSKLSNEQLQYIPAIGAQPDILKTLQLLPGIQSQNEGSSNLLVRGGSSDQNLFLIDNSSLFYINHLGGFISVFNPDVINDVRILKGGFPAKYGGKLSSVVDITLREGNKKEFDGSAGLGVFGANLTLEGPINDKASYLFSGRKTFTEALFAVASILQDDNYLVMYGFYDINGKVSWNPDPKNSLHFNLFLGDDSWSIRVFENNDEAGFINKWGNVLLSANWKQIINSRSRVDNCISVTRYRMRDETYFKSVNITDTMYSFNRYLSSVAGVSFKSDWKHRINSWYALDFGVVSSLRSYVPNKFIDEYKLADNFETITGLEIALYLENKISAGNWFYSSTGLRVTHYFTKDFSDIVFEPRINLSFMLPGSQALNVSYMKGSQYTHMVLSSGNFLNNEVWIPTMQGMKPASVDQISMGWKGQLADQSLLGEVDVYYKKMHDLVAFREGYANLRGDALWRRKLEPGGIGDSYGAEFFLSKEKGNYTGFISYAYSQTTRQFENLNDGKRYVYEYDRPHTFSIDIHRKLNEKLVFNALWVYQSGLPYTPAIARTFYPNTTTPDIGYGYETIIYGERNSARMRNYHRLDIALQLKTKTIRGREETWTFSIYNLYNRQNPYFYFYNTEPTLNFGLFYFETDRRKSMKLYQFSYFPIIPSVSYKVRF